MTGRHLPDEHIKISLVDPGREFGGAPQDAGNAWGVRRMNLDRRNGRELAQQVMNAWRRESA